MEGHHSLAFFFSQLSSFFLNCSPISGSSWYCLSLSESRKQSVSELTWLAFSWSTDLASIACQWFKFRAKVFMNLSCPIHHLHLKLGRVWKVFEVCDEVCEVHNKRRMSSLLAFCTIVQMHFEELVKLAKSVSVYQTKWLGQTFIILTWERNLLTLLDGWWGKELPWRFFLSLKRSDILSWKKLLEGQKGH